MEDFAEAWPTLQPQARAETFAASYITALRTAGAPQPTLTRENPLALRAGQWIAGFELERRAGPVDVLVERKVSLELEGLGFTLTARADRIEIARGQAHVIDFKTGAAPSKKEVKAGFNGQLPLTAAMIARGGLPGVSGVEPGELLYVRVTGRHPAGEVEYRGRPGQPDKTFPASEELVENAWAGLHRLVRRYQQPIMPYRSRTAPQFIKYKSDYDALARVHEWAVADDEPAWPGAGE
jgi:ATP-dependent helicase/nuclease subunit B